MFSSPRGPWSDSARPHRSEPAVSMPDLPTPAEPATRRGAIVRPTCRVRVSGVASAHPVLESAVDVAAHHEGPHEHRGCELPDGRGSSDVVTQGCEARTVGRP